ncbi:MAG: response regulator [Magnetococcales bacterium]|nr:response regulator [Magnetococcales bacterium]
MNTIKSSDNSQSHTSGRRFMLKAVPLTLAIFLFDILQPLDSAHGVLYLIVLLLDWRAPDTRNRLLFVATGLSLLVLLDFWLSDLEDVSLWIAIINRLYVLFAIWSVALSLWMSKQAMEIQDRQTMELEKLSAAVEQSPAAVIVTDAHGTIEYVNARFTALSGYAREELIGLANGLDRLGLREGARGGVRMGTSERPWRGELVNRKKNGESYWASVAVVAMRDPRGEIRHVIGVLEDITQRREHERRLAQANRALRGRLSFSEILAMDDEERVILERLCRALIEDTGYHFAWVGMTDPEDASSIQPVAFHGFHDSLSPDSPYRWDKASLEHHPTGKAIRTKTPCVIQGMRSEHPWLSTDEPSARQDPQACIALPLTINQVTIGALTVHAIQADAFDAIEIDLLRDLTAQMADGIRNLRERLQKKRLERELAANERRYRLLFDTMASGVAVYEAWDNGTDFIIKELNQAGYRITHTGPKQVTGRKVTEIFPGVRNCGLLEIFQKVYHTGTPASHPVTQYQDDHLQVWVENQVFRLESGEIVALFNDRTEQKQAEERLRNSEQLMRDLYENAPVAFLSVDAGNGHILRGNRAACTLFGRDFNHTKRIPLGDLLVDSSTMFLLAGPGVQNREVALHGENQTSLWVSLSVSPKMDERGTIIEHRLILVDHTERRLAEESLRQFAAIVAVSRDQMSFIGHDYIYRTVNPAYLLAHSKQRHEIVGHSVSDLLGKETFQRIRGNMDRCLRGESINFQAWFDFPALGRRWMDVSYFPQLRRDGRVEGLVVVSRDNTDRKRMEDELRASEERARLANRAKGAFLANMSHEIRTPMNAIMGMGHLLRQTGLSAQQCGYLSKIQAASESLLRLINDVLDFSKIDAGKLNLEQLPFDLYQVMERVTDGVLAKTGANPALEVLVSIPLDVPRQLVGDGIRLGQVLTNLCDNAVKFTPRGEVVLSVEMLSADAGQVTLEFEVRDTGIGIAADQIDRLMQPFQQADSSTTRRYGGTGLGLAICRNLVEMMGGGLTISSQPDVGSRFSFRIPLPVAHGYVRPPLETPEDLRGRRVLVVDDNAVSREILSSLLHAMAFVHAAVESGEAAIRSLRRAARAQEPVDLILMDWAMPGMDGIEAARRIIADPEIPLHPVIIMVSAFEREMVMSAAGEAGIGSFLHKPVTPSSLFDAIMERFGKSVSRALREATMQDPRGIEHLRGKRILVVDDLEDNIELIREILQRRGLEVIEAHDGQEALQAVRTAAPGHFDLVLMDVQMPVMDGIEASRHLATIPDAPPVIAMTASVLVEDVQACLAAGMRDHLAKPVMVEALLGKLLRWCTEVAGPEPDAVAVLETHEPNQPTQGPIDWSAGLNRCEGDAELQERLTANFRREFSDAVSWIREPLDQSLWAEATNRLHKLKGAAANIDALRLTRVAGAMESVLRKGDPMAAPHRMPELEEALNEVLHEIDRTSEKPEQVSRKMNVRSIDQNNLLHSLLELSILLDKGDIRCDVAYRCIESELSGLPGSYEVVTRLRGHMERLEMALAKQNVDALIHTLHHSTEP